MLLRGCSITGILFRINQAAWVNFSAAHPAIASCLRAIAENAVQVSFFVQLTVPLACQMLLHMSTALTSRALILCVRLSMASRLFTFPCFVAVGLDLADLRSRELSFAKYDSG